MVSAFILGLRQACDDALAHSIQPRFCRLMAFEQISRVFSCSFKFCLRAQMEIESVISVRNDFFA